MVYLPGKIIPVPLVPLTNHLDEEYLFNNLLQEDLYQILEVLFLVLLVLLALRDMVVNLAQLAQRVQLVQLVGGANPTFAGTPVSAGCFAGAGNSVASLSNYADIPASWK